MPALNRVYRRAPTLSDGGDNDPTPLSVALAGTGRVIETAVATDVYAQPLTVQALDAQGNTITVSAGLYLVSENGPWRFAGADPAS